MHTATAVVPSCVPDAMTRAILTCPTGIRCSGHLVPRNERCGLDASPHQAACAVHDRGVRVTSSGAAAGAGRLRQRRHTRTRSAGGGGAILARVADPRGEACVVDSDHLGDAQGAPLGREDIALQQQHKAGGEPAGAAWGPMDHM
jgi:hypothetical protein